jgi:hypothetical protein
MIEYTRRLVFTGRRAVMCCVLLVGCTADRAREPDTAADTSVARIRTAPGADSVPAVSSTAITTPKDTVIVLGTVERDLTGDGQPEVMRLTGVGQSTDSLDVTFLIESAGDTLFREQLRPLTTSVGFDAGRRRLSPSEHRAQLDEFDDWFLDSAKFMRPEEFVERLRRSAAGHIAEIPNVIARDRRRQASFLPGARLDSAEAVDVWNEIQSSGVTVFRYSPGGDGTTAIAWSVRDRRFYRLLECC